MARRSRPSRRRASASDRAERNEPDLRSISWRSGVSEIAQHRDASTRSKPVEPPARVVTVTQTTIVATKCQHRRARSSESIV